MLLFFLGRAKKFDLKNQVEEVSFVPYFEINKSLELTTYFDERKVLEKVIQYLEELK